MKDMPTKERILYAALDLIVEKGYDGVGVDLVAEFTFRYHLENLQRMYAGIFAKLIEKGILKKDDSDLLALEFISPVSLLIHMYDRQPERKEEVLDKIRKHFEHFAKVYTEK